MRYDHSSYNLVSFGMTSDVFTSIRTASTIDDYALIEIILLGNDVITRSTGDDVLMSYVGNDRFNLTAGNDTIDGGSGSDTASYDHALTAYRVGVNGSTTIVSRQDGEQLLSNIETLRFDGMDYAIADLVTGGNFVELMASHENDECGWELSDNYTGPVSYLEYQMLGTALPNVMGGTTQNDFFNLLGGNDAVDAGDGDDVIDGGTGSNFLTGGAGHDVFFLDGRGSVGGSLGQSTWSTITDWEAGEELSVWGWDTAVTSIRWVSSAGADGYQGVTLHIDFDNDGTIDASVTWTGKTQSELPSSAAFAASGDTPGLLWFV